MNGDRDDQTSNDLSTETDEQQVNGFEHSR